MPRRKSAPSLEELCLDIVICYFEEKEMQSQLVNQPGTLINNIFERLCLQFGDDKTDRRLQSNIFIHSGAVSLHHFNLFRATKDALYDKIGKECKNLVALRVHSGDFELQKVSIASQIKLMQSLPKLQRLEIESTYEFTDEVAAAIGKNCPFLTRLNFSHCLQLTNSGLRALSDCVKLENLNIESTYATFDGCWFILNQLPKLKVFEHSYWPRLFIELAQQPNRHETSRTYSIEKVPYTNNEHIPLLRTLFPNLRRLRLRSDETHLDFNVLTWPQRLTSLRLTKFRPVNIRLIDRAWPKLEKLTLDDCSICDESEGIIDAPLKNLRTLHVRCFLHSFITEEQMKTLLVPCTRLEKLSFCKCGIEVSDNLFSELIESNALQHLKSLELVYCKFITSISIIQLLGLQNNKLNKLEIRRCNNIDASAVEEINSYVKSNNLDVQWTKDYKITKY